MSVLKGFSGRCPISFFGIEHGVLEADIDISSLLRLE